MYINKFSANRPRNSVKYKLSSMKGLITFSGYLQSIQTHP